VDRRLLEHKVPMDTEERWVDVEDVAAHLNVTKDSIYRWIDRKGFPAHKVGRLFRFKLSEVDEWVRQGGGEEPKEVASE
jgi:excisionase family DNA binding protein